MNWKLKRSSKKTNKQGNLAETQSVNFVVSFWKRVEAKDGEGERERGREGERGRERLVKVESVAQRIEVVFSYSCNLTQPGLRFDILSQWDVTNSTGKYNERHVRRKMN